MNRIFNTTMKRMAMMVVAMTIITVVLSGINDVTFLLLGIGVGISVTMTIYHIIEERS